MCHPNVFILSMLGSFVWLGGGKGLEVPDAPLLLHNFSTKGTGTDTCCFFNQNLELKQYLLLIVKPG